MSAATVAPESHRDRRWIAVFVAIIVVAAIVSSTSGQFVRHAAHRHDYDSVQLTILIAIRETAAVAVLWFAASRYLHASAADFGIRYPRFREILFGVVVALVFGETVTRLIVAVVPDRAPHEIFIAIANGTLSWRLAALFVIGIYSPIVQEVVFRGLLLNSLIRPLGVPAAVAVSSAIFGALHAGSGPAWAVNAFAIGIVLSILYLRSRSLTAPIAAHIATNFVATATYIVLLGQAGR